MSQLCLLPDGVTHHFRGVLACSGRVQDEQGSRRLTQFREQRRDMSEAHPRLRHQAGAGQVWYEVEGQVERITVLRLAHEHRQSGHLDHPGQQEVSSLARFGRSPFEPTQGLIRLLRRCDLRQ